MWIKFLQFSMDVRRETTCYEVIVILSVLFDLPYLSLINIYVDVYACPCIASTPSH